MTVRQRKRQTARVFGRCGLSAPVLVEVFLVIIAGTATPTPNLSGDGAPRAKVAV